jgi:hypothetical protein
MTMYHRICESRVRSRLVRKGIYLPACEIEDIADDAVVRMIPLYRNGKSTDKKRRLGAAAGQACRVAIGEYFRQRMGDCRIAYRPKVEPLETGWEASKSVTLWGQTVEFDYVDDRGELGAMLGAIPNERLQIVAFGIADGRPLATIAKAADYADESGVRKALHSRTMRESLKPWKPASALQQALLDACNELCQKN